MKSKISIVILNYNGSDDTLECIESILNSKYKDFAIYIIDNHSNKNDLINLQKGINKLSKDKIKLIRSDSNKGFAGGNNFGSSLVESEFICFLNNDTIVDENWLESVIKKFEEDSDISIIQPKIKSYYNPNFYDYAGGAGGFIDLCGIPFSRGRVGFTVEEDCGQYDDIREIFWSSGCCLFMRVSDFKNIGGFDEDFFLYFEEVDLCYRIKNLGRKIVFLPTSTVFHKGSKSTNRENLNRVYFNHRNSLLTLLKNMNIFELLLTLPFRLVLDIFTSFFYLITNNSKSFFSVFKAYIYIFKNLKNIYFKRRLLKKTYLWDVQQINIPSIQIYYQILGKKTFQDLNSLSLSNPRIIDTYKISNNTLDLAFFFYTLICAVILTNIWFWEPGKIFQSGEESLYFINPELTAKIFSDGWYQTGYGYSMPIVIPRVLLFKFISYLTYFGFHLDFLQKLIFQFLIVSGLYGSFKLFKYLTNNFLIAFFSSSFYLLNLYSITQVWGRMLLTNIFVWSYLPIFLFCFFKIVFEKNLKILLIFNVLNIIYCFNYGLPSSIIVLWFIPSIVLLFNLNRFKHFLLFCLSWLLTSFWWLIPYLTLKNEAFSSLEKAESAYDSLLGVSKYFEFKDVIFLKQQFLLTDSFNNLYSSSSFYFLGLLFLLISTVGVFNSFKFKKEFILIIFLSLFLVLGTNTEFGSLFYKFIFEKISITQLLRNSYEKLGLIYLICYSLLFGLGIDFIIKKFSNKRIQIFIGLVLFTLLNIYSFPFYNGQVFGFGKLETKVELKNEYLEINKILLQDNSRKFRILLYPVIAGDGSRLTIGKSIYNGVEPSEYLYNTPTFSKIVRVFKFDQDYLSLSKFLDFNLGVINTDILDRYHIGYISIDYNYIDENNSQRDLAISLLEKSPEFDVLYAKNNIHFFKYINSKSQYVYLYGCNNKVTFINKSENNLILNINESLPINEKCKLILKEGYSKNWELLLDGKIIENPEIFDGLFVSWNLPPKNYKSIEIRFNPYKIL